MPFVTAGDLKIWYERVGSGPRLLYISGTGGDLRRPPNALLSPLKERFDLVAYDQRGLGRTDKPDGPYTIRQYADDAAALMEAIGWPSTHVVGVSFGGMVAQELAINHPSRIDKLVLCCCSTGGAGGSSYPLHELEHLPLEERIRLRLTRTDTRVNESWIAAHPDEYRQMYDKALSDAKLFADEPRRAEGARWQLLARAEHDTWDRIDQIRMPVLVCGGRHDGQAEPHVVETLAKRIPGAELAFFEGGHGFLNQDPQAYAKITAFLTE